MKQIEITDGLTFDDILLLPCYSEIVPSQVKTDASLYDIKLHSPLISAAMDTVTAGNMAIAMAEEGGMGIIHKNMSPEEQGNEVKKVKSASKDKKYNVGAACGVNLDAKSRVPVLIENGVDLIVVDTAHGHSKNVFDTVLWIKKNYHIRVCAGNVATYDGAKFLADCGCDVIKVGIGPGSICTTRVVAGIGVPQVTAIIESKRALLGYDVSLVADGGIRYSGDIVKALALGADAVMLGNLLAGTEESPGEFLYISDKPYKSYRGMGSIDAMKEGSKDRYFQRDIDDDKLVPEGIVGVVPYRGSVKNVLYQLIGGVRSGMGYVGAKNLRELMEKARFIKLSPASLIESHPHDIVMTQDAPNYTRYLSRE